MFKRRNVRLVVGLAAAVGLVLGGAAASQAASNTWYNSNATEWSTYSEPSSSYNLFSRTGQYVSLQGLVNGQNNLVYTKLWFGSTYTGSWNGTQSIGGARTVGVAGQGKFQFYFGGTQTYNNYPVVARATDAILVGTSRAKAPTIEGLSEADVAALATPATDYDVAVSDFRILADDDGTRLLKAEGDGWTVYTVLTADSVAFSTRSTTAEQDQRAAALYVVNPEAGVKAQYVFTNEKHRADGAAVEGLTEIGEGVFVDQEITSRVGYRPSLSRAGAQYIIPLSEAD